MSCRVIHADCLVALRDLRAGGELFDSCVTDPPYHLTSIVKRFGAKNAAPAQFGTDGAYARASRGFMGKQWDGGDIAFQSETWRAVFDVLKPGAHLVAFGGTRTYHRMAVAIEDAGFEIRDCLMWLYGTGFPKSHDVSKGIDKAAGAVRPVTGPKRLPNGREHHYNIGFGAGEGYDAAPAGRYESAPASPESAAWQGWGTALKPAREPIIVARRPLIGTVVDNVLTHGTGAINIDACRVEALDDYSENRVTQGVNTARTSLEPRRQQRTFAPASNGRWPANVLHDGSPEVESAFAAFGERAAGAFPAKQQNHKATSFSVASGRIAPARNMGDAGSAARFFYTAKADRSDRLGTKHPTVKPVDLMRWLCRLVTPPHGMVLDPFAGSGTTGEAAMLEGFGAVLIEREAEYVADIRRRMAHWSGGDAPLFAGDAA